MGIRTVGTPITLLRDRGNAADPNAIRVEHDGVLLGWVAREIAHPLAIVLDDTPPPGVTAHLATDTWSLAQESGTVDTLGTHNAIQFTVTLTPA
ncbi:HIRAN domain-containing protein [Streptomyces mirabilis]|uniref:HIRAN domain-containing protein n=1 Tax=Streptomyces mirabilis TaxID=68239 RepID=UPI00332D7AA3